MISNGISYLELESEINKTRGKGRPITTDRRTADTLQVHVFLLAESSELRHAET